MRERNSNIGRTIFTSISVTAIVLVLIGFSTHCSDSTANSEIIKEEFKASSVEIPSELDFCGEAVPLNYIDVRESLEREITVNTYWHSQTIIYIKRANRYFPEIEKILAEHNIPDDFKYLAVAESGLLNLISPAGATGFWQILKETARENGLEVNTEIDERYHLGKSTLAACKYLQQSYNKYQDWTLSAASYNAGRRGISQQLTRQKASDYYNLTLGDETGRYIFRILAFKIIMEAPEKYGFHISKDELYEPFPFKEEKVSGPIISFADYAIENGTNYKMLKILNPWLRDNKLTNAKNKEYLIRIPKSKGRLYN